MKRMFPMILLFALLLCVPVRADELTLDAPSALLMEKQTGTVLFAKDEHTPREPASVTKVMTLLLTMEAIDSGALSYDDTVTGSAHAASMGGSQIWLKEGEQMRVEDLIKAVCVVSGNDAAVALGVENGQFELNVMEPVISHNLFMAMNCMTNAVNTFVDKLLIGLEADEEHCKAWLDRSVGVVTALLPHIGYENSAMLAKEAYNTGKPIRQVILEKGILTKERMSHILSPKAMTTPGIAE